MNFIDKIIRWGLAFIGGCVVSYCVLVLAVVATAPDLRLRFLLVDLDSTTPSAKLSGIEFQQVPSDFKCKGRPPQKGDRLIMMDQMAVTNFLDFSRIQLSLRTRDFYSLVPDMDPLTDGLPPLVQDSDGVRWLKIEYTTPDSSAPITCAVQLQTVSARDVGLTLVWFLLQLLIFSVGAVAFWNRPFDDSARRFFAMSISTLGAFVGGFHWTTVAGSFWLTIPFAVSGILLPAVTLHFFMVYPRPKPPISHWPRIVTCLVYAIPAVVIVSFIAIEMLVWGLSWAYIGSSESPPTQFLRSCFSYLMHGVYLYLGVATLYFVLTLAALSYSVVTTRNPIELSQVRWILWAAAAAAVCIGYSLLIASFSRADFALGGARVPMFLASLLFMVAYAIGIVRYKLMLIEQIISKGMWYYVLSFGATGTVAFCIACGSLAVAVRKTPDFKQQIWIIAGILMLTVVLLIWLRDWWQRLIDRRFFREKYQLDKALQHIHRDMGRRTDLQYLSERMSLSCRDVLQSERVALYLREGQTKTFRLMAAEGQSTGLPMQLALPAEFVQALVVDAALQRVTPGSRDTLTPIQSTLRQVQADLVHRLDMDGELAGFVVLGPKNNGTMYSAEDLTFLTALSQITGVALHCAKVHQDITQLNKELHIKTEQIAQQARQITILQAELTTGTRPEWNMSPAVEFRRDAIIGRSAILERILDTVRKVSASETSVLVRGESGTGKELLAKAIHDNSPRREGPLISVHCAALSAGLLESELFGHVKGAFTGAVADKKGRFELAHGGTLFLDEIGDISADVQIKLLRVLQQREFEPVGSNKTIQVDVRLVAATHQNLERLIAEGKFREDLYYRINVVSLTLPPLRERPEDILDLVVSFLKRAVLRGNQRAARFDDEALQSLLRYSWPGNVRELQNVVERAIVMTEGETISVSDLPPEIQQKESSTPTFLQGADHPVYPGAGSLNWGKLEATAERQVLLEALTKCSGNKAQAARILGMPRSTFFSKLKKHDMDDGESVLDRIKRLPR
jgi:transcriptional regulator with GAF, ATPase, and Fis domain